MEDDIWQRKHEEQVEEEELTQILIARKELEKMLLPSVLREVVDKAD
ncbi:hypothetical protein [Synechococcus sp. BIOS-E4-1]|nr:hypothetical protein [Synechococcus sp. BIOS-E4-1]